MTPSRPPDSSAPKPLNPDRLAARLALRVEDGYIIEPIFPIGAMHCITGPPDVGKTTWFLQLLNDWDHGRVVLGDCKSHPCPWAYVALDRSLRDTDRTMQRLGMGEWDAPIYSMEELIRRGRSGKIELEPTLDQIFEKLPHIKMLAFEGLQGLMPNTGRGQSLNKAQIMWFMKIREQFLNRGITIIAVNHSPKSSDAAHDREDMLGSQGLIGGLGTVIKFTLPPDEQTGKTQGMLGARQTSDRLVSIMPKNSPPRYLTYTRASNGAFELVATASVRPRQFDPKQSEPVIQLYETTSEQIINMDHRFAQIAAQGELPLRTMKMWQRDMGWNDTQLFAWIEGKKTAGQLLCEGPGRYRRSGGIQ